MSWGEYLNEASVAVGAATIVLFSVWFGARIYHWGRERRDDD